MGYSALKFRLAATLANRNMPTMFEKMPTEDAVALAHEKKKSKQLIYLAIFLVAFSVGLLVAMGTVSSP